MDNSKAGLIKQWVLLPLKKCTHPYKRCKSRIIVYKYNKETCTFSTIKVPHFTHRRIKNPENDDEPVLGASDLLKRIFQYQKRESDCGEMRIGTRREDLFVI